MLMSLPDLIALYHLDIKGVLHLGAHLGEEADIYDELGCGKVWWVEGNPFVYTKLAANLAGHPDHVLIEALISDKDGELLNFNITNYDGMSSSLLEFGTHPNFSPDTVFEHKIQRPATTVDTLAERYDIEANFLNMDLQGAELLALKGATGFLRDVAYIMTEVNCDEVYRGCARVEQLDRYLTNFSRVETYWVPDQGWGDALYVRG